MSVEGVGIGLVSVVSVGVSTADSGDVANSELAAVQDQGAHDVCIFQQPPRSAFWHTGIIFSGARARNPQNGRFDYPEELAPP